MKNLSLFVALNVFLLSPLSASSTPTLQPWEIELLKTQPIPTQFPKGNYMVWEGTGVDRKSVTKNTQDFAEESVVIVVPGAFTPTCTDTHILPVIEGYNQMEKPNFNIYVLAKDTPDVMDAWKKHLNSQNPHIEFIGNPSFSLMQPLSTLTPNLRLSVISQRSVFFLKEGKIIFSDTEENNALVEKTSWQIIKNFYQVFNPSLQ